MIDHTNHTNHLFFSSSYKQKGTDLLTGRSEQASYRHLTATVPRNLYRVAGQSSNRFSRSRPRNSYLLQPRSTHRSRTSKRKLVAYPISTPQAPHSSSRRHPAEKLLPPWLTEKLACVSSLKVSVQNNSLFISMPLSPKAKRSRKFKPINNSIC